MQYRTDRKLVEINRLIEVENFR